MNQIATDYNYDDVPETFTRKQLKVVLRQHEESFLDFDVDHPVSETYSADDVMAWLGY